MNTILCNEKCTKCSHWKYKDLAKRLPVEKLIACLLSLKDAKELCIVGGEPLIFRKEIYKILEGIANSKIRTIIVTNGLLMNEKFIDTIRGYNIHIVVSIDTIDRDFWNFVRGTDSYNIVFKNLEYACMKLSPIQLSIQSVLSKETKPYLKAVSQYAKDRDIFHSIQDYVTRGFEGSWTEIEEKYANINTNEQQCYAAGRNLSILQNGDVKTCFQQDWISDCEKPLGNLNRESIEAILQRQYVSTVFEKMRQCNLPCKVLKCNIK